MKGSYQQWVIAILGGFGLTALLHAGASADVVATLKDPATFAATWTKVFKGAKWFVVIPHSYATITNTVFKLPYDAMLVYGALWISAFALTTLDTAARLGRLAWQELMEPLKAKIPSLYTAISHKWVASAIIVIPAAILAATRLWSVLWPAFGGMNQLLAALALFTSSLWAIKIQKTGLGGKIVTLTPAIFLWITVTIAIIWFEVIVIPPLLAAGGLKAVTGIAVAVILGISFILNIMLLMDFIKAYKRPT